MKTPAKKKRRGTPEAKQSGSISQTRRKKKVVRKAAVHEGNACWERARVRASGQVTSEREEQGIRTGLPGDPIDQASCSATEEFNDHED